MKICKICMNSDMLCSACNRKLEEGKITQAEIAMERQIAKINKEKNLGLEMIEIFEQNNRIFVIVDSKHAGKFIGPGGKNVRKLSEKIGKPIKLLEKAQGSEKHVLEKLLGVQIIGVNRVYSGTESLKVRVDKKYSRILPPRDIVEKIMGQKISFVFE